MSATKARPKSIDEYINANAAPKQSQKKLRELRESIMFGI
jgi:hypothetical protein